MGRENEKLVTEEKRGERRWVGEIENVTEENCGEGTREREEEKSLGVREKKYWRKRKRNHWE